MSTCLVLRIHVNVPNPLTTTSMIEIVHSDNLP